MVEGKRIRLEYGEGTRKDRHGRTLVYVYLEDGSLLNLEIIEQGYGHAQPLFPVFVQGTGYPPACARVFVCIETV